VAGLSNGVLLTGANAKIIVNGLTMAFATDISYRISVRHATPKVLGMYENQEFTPLAYDVTGTFTVIRYVKDAVNTAGGGPNGAVNSGNGIGNWTKASGILDAIGVPFGAGSDEGNADKSFVPRSLNIGHHFDIEIRQFVPVKNSPLGPGAGLPSLASSASSPLGFLGNVSGANASNSLNQNLNSLAGENAIPTGQCGVVKLKACRITEASFTMSKRSAARQTFQFYARYADEDSFTADKSGIGQDLE